MEKKRSIGVMVFGVIFILMTFNIAWHYRTFAMPLSKSQARIAIKSTVDEAGIELNESQIQKLINESTSFTYYWIRGGFWLILLCLYLICGLGILLGKNIYYVLIISTFLIRIITNIFYYISYYSNYRYPFIVISKNYFPIPTVDSKMAALFFVWFMGILFSIVGIYFFTRPKVKEQFKSGGPNA